MTIQYKTGDLIAAFKAGEVLVIAHQANCMNTMGSGVAKAIREAFPQAYEADCVTRKGDKEKLGGFTVSADAEFGLIFNLYGQYDYGREAGKVYTDLSALRSAMSQMATFLRHIDYRAAAGTIGLPKLGAGLGGAKWEDVAQIIEEELCDFDVVIYSL